MNLQSLIVILQMVVQLLSNPSTATNPQVQSLAMQVIQETTQVLSMQSTSTSPTGAVQAPVSTPHPTIIYQIVQATPAPTPIPTPTPVVPTCSLVATVSNASENGGDLSFKWSISGMNASTTGDLYILKENNHWHKTPLTLNGNFMGQSGLLGLGAGYKWKAIFGNATCFASFPMDVVPYNGETSN